MAVAGGPRGRQGPLARAAEDEWGAWGTLYFDDDGHLLGSMQCGPAELFPRAGDLPAGPPSDDALLVTCAYLVERSTPWVMQSLFLAAIGDARDKGARAVEAFGYRYGEGSPCTSASSVHRTVFPHDFLADFGFQVVRTQGRVELARLELGGLVPVLEGKRPGVLRVLREIFSPSPSRLRGHDESRADPDLSRRAVAGVRPCHGPRMGRNPCSAGTRELAFSDG